MLVIVLSPALLALLADREARYLYFFKFGGGTGRRIPVEPLPLAVLPSRLGQQSFRVFRSETRVRRTIWSCPEARLGRGAWHAVLESRIPP